MIRPEFAWPLRRVLVGCSVNGELDALPEPLKAMAEYLAVLTAKDRPAAWEAMLAAREDRDELIIALANVDPLGLPPAPSAARLDCSPW